MGQKTNISWTNDTWNPWQGCRKVSNGCAKCYMFREKLRYGQKPGEVVRSKTVFDAPLKKLKGPLVFVCSWSDFFIKEADAWRDEAWQIIKQCDHLTFQILTKRPGRMVEHLPADWGEDGYPNVWLGVSAEDQKQADTRIPYLTEVNAAVKFVSIEPMLGPVNIRAWTSEGHVDWVIVGGESGPTARGMSPVWAWEVMIDCDDTETPFFFKQHGGNLKVDGAYGGDKLYGVQEQQWPFVWEMELREQEQGIIA